MQPEAVLRLQRQAAELGQLARDLGSTIPRSVEGSDPTGWVVVVLGRDGMPTEVRVREGWQQRLGPGQLADAVLGANNDALRRAMETWTRAVDDDGWWRRRADVEATAGESSEAHVRDSEQATPFGQTRDENDLAEEVLSKLRAAQSRQPGTPAKAVGQDDGKHVTVELALGGLTACAIEPDWAKNRAGTSISSALAVALRRAAARYLSPSAEAQPDSLVGDALATLRSLTAGPPTQGGTE
ncbi:hypothetical protein [Actinoplanes sp. M2I2]|uniref:hypothetical protein n=1 Tax=Actinoplanes sp. M2I2 TaxID=1734444 RepID=UPI00201FE609|nr:hypothetical protein [Actinoplanes sp. M2I2]